MTREEHQQVLEWACKQGRFLGGHDLYGPMLVTKKKAEKPMNNTIHINGGGLEEVKQEAVRSALALSGGSKRKAARLLKISQNTIYDILKRTGLILGLLLPAACLGQSLTLGWDPSSSPGVTNYVIYATTNSFNYYQRSNAVVKIGVGTNLTAQITDIRPGRYWFTATAIGSGIESSNSNVLILDVPKPPANLFTIQLQYLFSLTNNEAKDLGFFKIKTP